MKQLFTELETVRNIKSQVLSGQKKAGELSLSYLVDCEKYVEQSLITSGQQQLLMSKKQMIEHMNRVTQQINIKDYYPLEKVDVQFVKNSNTFLNFGEVIFFCTPLEHCKIKKIDQVNRYLW